MLGIIQWFKARKRIDAERSEAVAFTIAERIDSKKYVEVSDAFDQAEHGTSIVQGFYDSKTEKIMEAPPPSELPGERAE
jgi:hypothetical protein